MKVTSTTEKSFKPVSINITFETEEELCKFFCSFNHEGITRSLENESNARKIREVLKDSSDVESLYGPYFERFINRLRDHFVPTNRNNV